ncbi:MAG: hypothetical protein V4591_03115 [Bdellovibrionota bacterium]
MFSHDQKTRMKSSFNEAKKHLDLLVNTTTVFATRFISDAKVRIEYKRAVKASVDEIKAKYMINSNNFEEFERNYFNLRKSGLIKHITGSAETDATQMLRTTAKKASTTRNLILQLSRGETSAVGLLIAMGHKRHGLDFEQVLNKNTKKIFEKDGIFFFKDLKTEEQRSKVYLSSIFSSGEDSKSYTKLAKNANYTGKGLIILNAIIVTYVVANSKEKIKEGLKLADSLITSNLAVYL